LENIKTAHKKDPKKKTKMQEMANKNGQNKIEFHFVTSLVSHFPRLLFLFGFFFGLVLTSFLNAYSFSKPLQILGLSCPFFVCVCFFVVLLVGKRNRSKTHLKISVLKPSVLFCVVDCQNTPSFSYQWPNPFSF